MVALTALDPPTVAAASFAAPETVCVDSIKNDTVSEQRIAEHLSAFGFPRKEIDTYLAVLRRRQATTGEVAAAADVSQGYVYEVAETLVDRGLLTVDEGANPAMLRARPAAEAVAVKWIHYQFDFGDNWEHIITVEESRGRSLDGDPEVVEIHGPVPPQYHDPSE